MICILGVYSNVLLIFTLLNIFHEFYYRPYVIHTSFIMDSSGYRSSGSSGSGSYSNYNTILFGGKTKDLTFDGI